MLDQFYTNENIAIECIKKLQKKVDIEKYDKTNVSIKTDIIFNFEKYNT